MINSIKQIFSKSEDFSGEKIIIAGWIKSIRRGKENTFIHLSDGSSLKPIQVFFSALFTQKEILKKLNFGSSLSLQGVLKITPDRTQPFEIVGEKIISFCQTSDEYPLQKQQLPLSLLREYPQFRAKTNHFFAVFKIRSETSRLIHKFFEERNFFYVNTPIITSNDAEGSGEAFEVIAPNKENFFQTRANLTVSGQLHAEALVQGLGKVYNFSPCFRAENSNTTRHLAEFWMIEAEVAFAGLNQIIELVEDLIKYLVKGILMSSQQELIHLSALGKASNFVSELELLISSKFPRFSYTECIRILQKKNSSEPGFFGTDEIYWGIDLKADHEKYLTSLSKLPTFITDYPANLKAFYMKENPDKKTVACVDLLFPRVGEVIGGSARENNYEKIVDRAKRAAINSQELKWYLDLRKDGYAPSAGFGLGLERIIMFLTNIENIRDSIVFPRAAKELKF